MLSFIQSVILSNVLTVYYALKMLFLLGLYSVTHPFSNPWTPKLRLMPPEVMKHPKYGTHKYMKCNNVKIHYAESGDPSKPLLVFMHGYPEFWYSWRHQIVEFNKDYWCIAIDMRGYGDSEKPEKQSDYKITEMVEDLRDLVRQMGREKFILVAHDWGGGIGWKYRDMYPETLSAYVSIASTTLLALSKLIHEDREQFQKSWYLFLNRAWWVPELVMSFKNLQIFDSMMGKKNNPYITKDDIECYKFVFGKPGAFTPPINYYRENFSYSTPKETPQNDVPVPCLFLQAEKDNYLVKKHAELVSKQYINCEAIILEGCGHFCQQENPEKVNAVIREFLSKHDL